jgi:prephenate dehydratase
MTAGLEKARVAFQGEHGAFSEAAIVQLLGGSVTTVPRPTFDSAFSAIRDGAADALLAPVENTLAGSVVRVFDLLLESNLTMVDETILHIEHQLIGCPGATLADIRSISSHPVALAQCEKFFLAHPQTKRVPAEDTAGSVRDTLARGDKSFAGIAGRRAADIYGGLIVAENIHDNPENFTRFVLLLPSEKAKQYISTAARKMSLALRLAHRPGALLAALEPFSRHGINLLKIESRPIPGSPWEYQFYLDVESQSPEALQSALDVVKGATSQLRILGLYPAARIPA